MGNTESNVTSGVKKQAGVSTQPLYKLVNLKGGGLLVDMMKRACQSKQYAEIDHAIKTKVAHIALDAMHTIIIKLMQSICINSIHKLSGLISFFLLLCLVVVRR